MYSLATQMVFGEEPVSGRVMMIGEQPGDQEDLQGHPFVRPTGKLLNQALEEAEMRSRLSVRASVKSRWLSK